MNQEQLLQSVPITEVTINQIGRPYIARVQKYVESLGCTINALDGGAYHIVFPEGTKEETYVGQSTQWTRKTIVRFPTGQTLSKYVLSPLSPSHPYRTMLAFPIDVLYPPPRVI